VARLDVETFVVQTLPNGLSEPDVVRDDDHAHELRAGPAIDLAMEVGLPAIPAQLTGQSSIWQRRARPVTSRPAGGADAGWQKDR
jgi:hypothetical protein